MSISEMEIAMQKWPYAKIGYLNVEHFRSSFQNNDPTPKWEYLTVEAMFIPLSENAVIFFDHYTKEYKGQRNELDDYLAKLGAEGWKLTVAFGDADLGQKGYTFRRLIG
jgi:hypothetical protein